MGQKTLLVPGTQKQVTCLSHLVQKYEGRRAPRGREVQLKAEMVPKRSRGQGKGRV